MDVSKMDADRGTHALAPKITCLIAQSASFSFCIVQSIAALSKIANCVRLHNGGRQLSLLLPKLSLFFLYSFELLLLIIYIFRKYISISIYCQTKKHSRMI